MIIQINKLQVIDSGSSNCFSQRRIHEMNDERRKVWLARQEDLNRTAIAKKMMTDDTENINVS